MTSYYNPIITLSQNARQSIPPHSRLYNSIIHSEILPNPGWSQDKSPSFYDEPEDLTFFLDSKTIKQILRLPPEEIPTNSEVCREIDFVENLDNDRPYANEEDFRKRDLEKIDKFRNWRRRLLLPPDEEDIDPEYESMVEELLEQDVERFFNPEKREREFANAILNLAFR